jgi:nanoRNase/pAp phosphatase (c-di-AMP/oligoRNAs hydrolase)
MVDLIEPTPVSRLLDLLKPKRKLLILTHNDPDPDAIAAAVALRELLMRKSSIRVTIAYGGIISRAENIAMVKLLSLGLRPLSDIDIRDFPTIATIDTQPGAGNCPLGQKRLPQIVIDHHRPLRKQTKKADFIDVRYEAGSSSSILVEYFSQAELAFSTRIATALYYGIISDISGWGRESKPGDVQALAKITPFINMKKLSRIQHPRMPRAHYSRIAEAYGSATIHKDAVVCDMKSVKGPEFVAQLADKLVRLEGTRWSFVVGQCGDTVHFSLRTILAGRNVDRLAVAIARGLGTGGGHAHFAAGQVYPEKYKQEHEVSLSQLLIDRFLAGIDRREIEPVLLVAPKRTTLV